VATGRLILSVRPMPKTQKVGLEAVPMWGTLSKSFAHDYA